MLSFLAQDYWCCIITRDGAETIGRTIDSITSQTQPPKFIVIVNDGSTDDTENIIYQKKAQFANIFVVKTGSKIRDIRKVPRLLNGGIEFSKRADLERVKYMMVSGDDNVLSADYAREMMRRM